MGATVPPLSLARPSPQLSGAVRMTVVLMQTQEGWMDQEHLTGSGVESRWQLQVQAGLVASPARPGCVGLNDYANNEYGWVFLGAQSIWLVH